MEKTRVKFYINDTDENFNPDVFAVFPDEILVVIGKPELLSGYQHVGQHGHYHIDYIKESKVATKEQYQDLYDELTNLVGYDLEVLNKIK
jgi:hypothetical protein